jgi:uroporphyrin-III C-methyltransferase
VVRLRAALDWIGALDGRKLSADPFANRILRNPA